MKTNNVHNRLKIKVDKKRTISFINKFTFTKKIALIIPFILISSLLIIAPLVIIIVNAFTPVSGDINDNWGIITGTILEKIGKSLWISVVSTILCFIIAFPFCYSLLIVKNKTFRTISLFVVTAPIWINLLIKLIGIKSFFDILNHETNSTYGDIYTIIGLVYLFAPFMIMPIYSALETLPKNLINASKDLGRGQIYTFFRVVIPWCKLGIISGITLVLLPCFTTVTVPSFLNNSNDGGMIGDIIVDQGNNGLSNPISLSRTSVLVLVVSAVTLFVYSSIVYAPKVYSLIKKGVKKKHEK